MSQCLVTTYSHTKTPSLSQNHTRSRSTIISSRHIHAESSTIADSELFDPFRNSLPTIDPFLELRLDHMLSRRPSSDRISLVQHTICFAKQAQRTIFPFPPVLFNPSLDLRGGACSMRRQ